MTDIERCISVVKEIVADYTRKRYEQAARGDDLLAEYFHAKENAAHEIIAALEKLVPAAAEKCVKCGHGNVIRSAATAMLSMVNA